MIEAPIAIASATANTLKSLPKESFQANLHRSLDTRVFKSPAAVARPPLRSAPASLLSAATIVSYSFYTFSAVNLPANHSMMLTIPFFVYIIFRYLYLVQMTDQTGAPEEVLLTDRPVQIAIGLMGLTVLAVFYLFK